MVQIKMSAMPVLFIVVAWHEVTLHFVVPRFKVYSMTDKYLRYNDR